MPASSRAGPEATPWDGSFPPGQSPDVGIRSLAPARAVTPLTEIAVSGRGSKRQQDEALGSTQRERGHAFSGEITSSVRGSDRD